MDKQKSWKKQEKILRRPHEIFGAPFAKAGITEESLAYNASNSFVAVLKKLRVTLLVSREYENLLITLSVPKNKLEQTFFHIPHPSGIAVDHKTHSVYVASTRNPNQIVEFKPQKEHVERTDERGVVDGRNILMPARAKYYGGMYYFHDLALIAGKLYANAVGMNGVVEVDMNSGTSDKLVWWPKSTEAKGGKPDTRANYIQLNSIAAGKSLSDSYFSASGAHIRSTKPRDATYPVDGEGVIFSGKTRTPIAHGLTRPHSLRYYKKRLFVDNSGYGEVGYIQEGKFHPVATLPGWTRGLCIIDDILLAGTSRILPRFRQYAPGVDHKKARSGIHAIDLKNMSSIGTIEFPHGNQIFAIEHIAQAVTEGFLYKTVKETTEKEQGAFFSYQV